MDINTGPPAFIILSPADIAERAYQLYVERGRVDGFDREDWLRGARAQSAAQEDDESAILVIACREEALFSNEQMISTHTSMLTT